MVRLSKKNIAFILAGGKGTRLWPLSRENYPKQFVEFLGGFSLFQLALKRALAYFNSRDIYIIASGEYQFTLANQIEELKGISGRDKTVLKENFIFEPEPKNTLPAVLLGLKYVENKYENEDFTVFVFPSDHYIAPVDKFIYSLKKSQNLSEKNRLVVFGIKPEFPKPGFGYILPAGRNDLEGFMVRKFVEKPSLAKAASLIKQGALWNSGMFCFGKKVFLEELKLYMPKLHAVYLNNDYGKFLKKFRAVTAVSLDYGIMQKTKKAAGIKFTADWSDLGSWESFFEFFGKGKNTLPLDKGIFVSCRDCFSFPSERLIAGVGLKDLLIIDSEDSVLVLKKEYADKVKDLVSVIKKKKLRYFKESRTVYRPWGYYTVLKEKPGYKVKEIGVLPKRFVSLQRHKYRSEHWNIVEGEAEVTLGRRKIRIKKNQSIFVPKRTKHRIYNPKNTVLKIIEVQIGSYLGEDDIERFDKYKI